MKPFLDLELIQAEGPLDKVGEIVVVSSGDISVHFWFEHIH